MKLTKIAIALVAVLAMSAVVASGASAKQLTSPGNNSVVLEGQDLGNHVFSVGGQNVTCTEANFASGTIAVPANTINGVSAAYNGCTAFGFAGATVNMGNCHYAFTTPTKLKTDEYTTEVAVICDQTSNSASNKINVKSSVFGSECEVSISQTNWMSHVIVHNTTNNPVEDLTLTIAVNNIPVSINKDNGLCPLAGNGNTTKAATGTYNGNVTVKDKNGKHITLSD